MVTTLHLYWRRHGTTEHLERRWVGDLPADQAVRVGMVDTAVPLVDGELTLRIDLHDAGGEAVAQYEDRAPVRTGLDASG
jgi:hypothetical protein